MKYMNSSKKLVASVLLLGAVAMGQAADILSFPEAVGFGRYATGGRAGKVYHVTNLNDSGTGSFRDAVSSSNRIVVFDVGGNIRLKSAVQVQSNITIAGQTAPGGIAIDGGKISCGSKSNIIIRHIRVRPGSETASTKDDGINMYRSQNCIIDHCSVEFSPWNNIGGSGSNDYKSTDITFQYCLIANPIYQQFGAHIESVNSQWTWYGNCFANTHNRNPLDKVNDIFVNNVLYNYQGGYTTHTSTKFSHDIINNYFVGGPNSGSTDNTWFQVDKNQSIYYSGNMKDRDKDGVLNGSETTPYWYQGTGTVLSSPWSSITNTLPTISAASAFRMVSSNAGAQPIDQLDEMVWANVQSIGKTGSMYTSQTATGLANDGYGVITSSEASLDSDKDGMPDFWELAMGLNPTKDDAMTKREDGYANIEGYINWLGALHEKTEAGIDLTINLADYTKGWSNVSPSYKVSNGQNCSVTVSGSKVSFTPDYGFYGLASFDYTVTGNDGTSYTNTVWVLVEKSDNVIMYVNGKLQKQGGGSSSQTIYTNESIDDFQFAWDSCSSVSIVWEPSIPDGIVTTIDRSSKTIKFTGKPTSCGSYKYTVTTLGATNAATKSGTISVEPRSYYFSVSNSNGDWTEASNWLQAAIPFDCDTAIIQDGEVNIGNDVRCATYVKSVFRIRSNVAVRELHLVGGTLKSYTSNPEFRLTAVSLYVDEPSMVMCGSNDTAMFKVSGTLYGTENLTKTGVGVLVLNETASQYTGWWNLTAGTIRVVRSNALGTNGISVASGATLDIEVASISKEIELLEGAKLNLDADFTVSKATIGDKVLQNGTYTKNDFPSFISGDGSLIIDNNYPSLIKEGTGENTQELQLGNSIESFHYTWENATTVNVDWMDNVPEGINVVIEDNNKQVSFSGKPTKEGVYAYTISIVGTTDSIASVSGCFTVVGSSSTFLSDCQGGSLDFIVTPNPIVDVLTIGYYAKNETEVQISLYSMDGTIKTDLGNYSLMSNTYNQITINGLDIPQGSYLLKCVTEFSSKVVKIATR